MTGSRVVVVGDVIDDIIVVPAGPIRPDTDTTARISRHAGGSAANTAAWMSSLGVDVDFVGCVGAGDRERHSAALRAHGVTAHLSEDSELVTGTIVIIVDGEQRTMLTDRGANSSLGVAQVTDELLANAGVLHLTGYSLVDSFTADELSTLIERAHAHAVLVTLDPGSVGFIDDYGADAFRDAIRGIDVLLPNHDEGRLLAGVTDTAVDGTEAMLISLLDLAPAVVLTHGAGTVAVARRDRGVERVDVHPVEVVDPTGAGDAFTAGLISALLTGVDLVEAAAAGVRVAAVAVTRAGARPA
ncbi:MAG: hypothetical protein KIT89_11130 [Microcella sp.]|uniref:carbohydrate kinase family protein n=1 Tax=Microcella sp. TaxID=1913979 RepID=UPI0024C7E4DC|nr:PfkB family carbohydrate kinase [Microcella sp.]UYN83239.1 MAG: hypothetical protein KIT89_11130 [Microcella sp.]